jgi:hypothetical protein
LLLRFARWLLPRLLVELCLLAELWQVLAAEGSDDNVKEENSAPKMSALSPAAAAAGFGAVGGCDAAVFAWSAAFTGCASA